MEVLGVYPDRYIILNDNSTKMSKTNKPVS